MNTHVEFLRLLQRRNPMDINEDSLYQYLLFSSPIRYTNDLVLYPVKMGDILDFSLFKSSITVRKNSIFPVKRIIKMSYLEFIFYCHNNIDLAIEYQMPLLPRYYSFAFMLLKLAFNGQEVLANPETGGFKINGIKITDDQFDDIRRIIIIQNGIDFDIDEFLHYDTEQELLKAQDAVSGKEKASLEDYIDSVCVGMDLSEDKVRELTIRKFWRYVKRISKRDVFNVMKSAESSGMVKFKEPVQYWMCELDDGDKFKDVKTDSQSLQKMISG